MRRLTIFSLLWLGCAILCAATSSVVAEVPASSEQLAADAIRAGQTQDRAAMKALMEQLRHESPMVRQSSAWALGQFGASASEAVSLLMHALGDSDVRVRWVAATTLGRIGRPAQSAEPALWQASLDRDIDVRCAALMALRTVSTAKSSEAMSALRESLQSSVADVQGEAIATLSAIHSRWNESEKRTLAAQLGTVLSSKNDDLRLAAAVLLGEFGLSAAEAIGVLASAADDLDEHVQTAALQAVERFAGEVDRRWNQLDSTQRTALRQPCDVAAMILKNRGNGSAGVVRVAQQFERLNDGIQLISTERTVNLQKPIQSAAKAELLLPMDSSPKVTQASPSLWRWTFALLLAGIGLWGLRQGLSSRSTATDSTANDAQAEPVLSEKTSVATIRVEDVAARREAINSLSDIALDAAATLNLAMSDADSVVRWRSASAVTAVHSATVPQLLAAVTSEDPEVRRLAITSLRGLGANAVSPFVQALQDNDARMRQAAAVTLGQIGLGAIDAVPQLVTALSDTDSRVRAAAAFSLSTFGAHAMEAVPALRAALSDEFASVRARAAFALGQIGPSARRTVEELVRLVSDPDVSVRRNAVSALGGIGADTAVVLPALRQAMNDEDDGVHRCAATSLAVIDRGAIAAGAERSSERTPIGSETVRQSRETSLSTSSPSADVSSKSTVESCGPSLKVFDPEQLIPSEVASDTQSLLEAADLIVQLEDIDADVRWKASQGLEQLGVSAVPEMIASLNHRNPAVRRLLLLALGRVGTEARAAMPAMLVALHDVNADVRCAAADGLGQLGVVSRSMVQALVQALSDPNAEVRRYAATTLGRFGQQGREAMTALQIASISDMTAKVRSAAQTALQRISESLVGAA